MKEKQEISPPQAPQVLGFSDQGDFKAYFFKHFVWTKVFANRGQSQVRVMFASRHWDHVFWHDGECFDLERAERMPWILEALERPEAIYEGRRGDRDVYLLTKKGWGEDFCVIVDRPNRRGVSHFITAYPLELASMLKLRLFNRQIWP